jgi:hypothetical protein
LMTQRDCSRQSADSTTRHEHAHSLFPPLDVLSDFT